MVWNRDYLLNKLLPVSTIVERVDEAIAGRSYKSIVFVLNGKMINESLYMQPHTNKFTKSVEAIYRLPMKVGVQVN